MTSIYTVYIYIYWLSPQYSGDLESARCGKRQEKRTGRMVNKCADGRLRSASRALARGWRPSNGAGSCGRCGFAAAQTPAMLCVTV